MEDQAENDDQHGNDGKKFQMGQTAAGEAVPEKKMQFKTHPWNDEKCKRLPKGRLRNRENVYRMYRNVSECIGQKKWSYTCITRKNGVIHV